MSFLISTNRLFGLTQPPRLRKLIQGKFSVQVLPSPTTGTTPYYCDLSSETVRVTLDAALANTNHHLSTDRVEERESFIGWLLKKLEVSDVVRQKTTVHAELAMIMAMPSGTKSRTSYPTSGSRNFPALCAVTISAPSMTLRGIRSLSKALTK